MNLVHSRAVRKQLVAIILSIVNCMFYSCQLSAVPWWLPWVPLMFRVIGPMQWCIAKNRGGWRRVWRYSAYLWSLRWVYAIQKNPEVGIRRIPAYTPQTPLDPCESAHLPNGILISSAIISRRTVVSKSSLVGQLLVTLQLICHFLGLNIRNKALPLATALFHILHVIPQIFCSLIPLVGWASGTASGL